MVAKGKKTSAKKTSKAKAPTKKQPVVQEPVVQEPVVQEPVVQEPVVQGSVDDFMNYEELDNLRDMLKTTLSMCREMSSMIVKLEKKLNKDRKVAIKKLKKRQPLNPDGTKPLNGFSKPGDVSNDLRSFMGLADGELVARVDVTKFITKYCQDNGLQNENDKRILIPDDKLQSLLNIDTNVELTYFNLQKYLKYHFPNKDGVFPSKD